MTGFPLTPSQTVGPFFHDAMLREPLNVLVAPGAAGERIRIEGRVYDGDGAPVPDAVIEIWQANGTAATTTRPTGAISRSIRPSPASGGPARTGRAASGSRRSSPARSRSTRRPPRRPISS